MDKKVIKNYQIFSAIFTFILGSLLHFTYTWSGNNPAIALFSSVNESVWEHLKLIYFPMLLTTILGHFYFKDKIHNFICSKTVGILTSISFLIVFFYTYTGILGSNIPIVDILSFFISAILGEFVSYIFIINKYKCNNILSIICLILIFICFVIFTKYTPNLGIFCDPIVCECSLF